MRVDAGEAAIGRQLHCVALRLQQRDRGKGHLPAIHSLLDDVGEDDPYR
jgi:hypothetical protein